MARTALITGGAGFLGSHLARELLDAGYAVRALDSLEPQVHGEGATRPDYLHPDVELIQGDVGDREVLRRALVGIDAVYHFAARVGVGQSMYEIARYTQVNDVGTAILLEELIARPVRRLVVASSMSIYGEGLYRDDDGALHPDVVRSPERLRRGEWEPRGPGDVRLTPVPTPEDKPPALASVYALTKFDQERLCLMVGQAYDIPVVAVRFFNAYGPHQALSNPYTGVLAIFASRLLNGRPPLVFEDGLQQRDFVHVHDVARACRLALETDAAVGQVVNVGSGRSITVREVAQRLAHALGRPDIEPEITGDYRVGDVRHCFADLTRARELLGYEPQVDFDTGTAELVDWLRGQVAIDRTGHARSELQARGLAI